MFGIGVAAQIFAHLFGKIHHHLIMQGADLVGCVQVVQLLDVEIAEAVGCLQVSPPSMAALVARRDVCR